MKGTSLFVYVMTGLPLLLSCNGPSSSASSLGSNIESSISQEESSSISSMGSSVSSSSSSIEEDLFDYRVFGDYGCSVSLRANVKNQRVVVPSSYQGVPVIYLDSFRSDSLVEIYIPSSVKTIGAFCFEYDKNLAEVHFDEGLEVIGTYAFAECPKLASIALPNSLQVIYEHAFDKDASLSEVSFGEGLRWIFDEAFSATPNLTSVTLPSTYRGTRSAFLGSGVKALHVDSGNPIYDESGGALYIQDKNTLFLAPSIQEETFIIPEGTETIGEYACSQCCGEKISFPTSLKAIGEGAFWESDFRFDPLDLLSTSLEFIGEGAFEASALATIILPDTLQEIGEYAFCYCDALSSIAISGQVEVVPTGLFEGCLMLSSVSLPASIQKIEPAFYGCEALSEIVFAGSKSSWDALEKEADWKEGSALQYVSCIDGRYELD